MHVDAQKYVFDTTNNSLFQAFHTQGYLTAMFGKLTNDMTDYFCNDNPPKVQGFDRIQAPCDYDDFYGLKFCTCTILYTYTTYKYIIFNCFSCLVFVEIDIWTSMKMGVISFIA